MRVCTKRDLTAAKRRYNVLKHLRFSNNIPIHAVVFSRFTLLTTLEIADCMCVTLSVMPEHLVTLVLRKCLNIVRLDIQSLRVLRVDGCRMLRIINTPMLSELTLRCCHSIARIPESVHLISMHLSRCHKLVFSGESFLGLIAFHMHQTPTLQLPLMPQLRVLYLSSCRFVNIPQFNQFPQLADVYIDNCLRITEIGRDVLDLPLHRLDVS